MEKPLVSVNICTHNRRNLIKKALDSVLVQDYPNIEIIISDNGNDDTEEIINDINNPRIKYFKNTTTGISQNRNFALGKSNGKYIAVLDSDDYWLDENKISRQVKFLEENFEYALIGTNAIIVNEENNKIGEIKNKITDQKIRENLLLKNQFVHSSVLFKKDYINKYNEEIYIWEDYDLFLKIAKKYKVANLPEFTTAYKKHSQNVSNFKRVKGVLTLEKIIKQHKKDFPNYFSSRFKNMARLFKAILNI